MTSLERAWYLASRIAVPVMMTLAYLLLAATSDTNLVGKAWMGVGLGIVLVIWFVFRALTETAALARALAVGDVAKLDVLGKRSGPAFALARAAAAQLRGEFAAAARHLDGVQIPAEYAAQAAAVQIGARVELGAAPEELRRFVVRAPRTPALVALAEAEIAYRADDLASASEQLTRVIDDIRAGSAARAIAHIYAARIADTRGDAPAAARHRAAALQLATPDATWLRSQAA